MKIVNWFLGLPKKTKIIAAIITSAVIVSIGVGVTLNATKHIHSYDELVTAPTCIEQGFTTYTCSCGDSYVENYVNALGHTEVVDVAVAPTCVKTGLTEGKHCSVCNEVIIAQQTVSATGHSFTNENASYQYLKSYANCENGAIYYKSCSCGKKGSETFEYGEKLGHSYDRNIATSKYLKTEATCINVAVYYKSCKCGAKGSETFEYGEKLGHSYDRNIATSKYLKTEATCINVAVYYKSCKCGEKGIETFEYGSTLPHDFGIYSKTKNATCTENAKETAYCQNKDCNESDVRDIEGTALGHGDITTSNVCTICNKEVEYTKGMVYVAVTGGYQLIDMGSATDTDIIIPKYYNGSPVISIGDEVFMNKTTLRSISFPDTIISIGDSAFLGCSNIKELILPKSVKSIGDEAFAHCVSLEYLTIPCLQKKSSLGYVYQTLRDLFMELAIDKSYIPSDVTNVYEVESSYSGTYYYYWYKPENLKKITFLETVEKIPDNAFDCFDMVEEIELPNTIKTIGDNAFNNCKSLKSINIPDSVTSIGYMAFWSCNNLKEVKLGSGLIEIDTSAFGHCTSLTEITISSSVKSIGSFAFVGCTQLNKITFKNTSGWKVGANVIDVSNPSTNAILFKKTYVSSSWSRS